MAAETTAAETTAAVVAAHPTSWLRRGRAKASRLSRLLGSIVHLKKPNIGVATTIYISILPRCGAMVQNGFCVAAFLDFKMAPTRFLSNHSVFLLIHKM